MAVYDIPSQEFNEQLAEQLTKIPEFKMPEWALFVKTGVSKIKPPTEKDWWHKRAASILRQIYIKKVVGVNRLKIRYGSKKNRGVKPEKFFRASGKIIRTIIQQAEQAGFLEKVEDNIKKGRKLTEKGKEFMDNIQVIPKKEAPVPQESTINKKASDNSGTAEQEDEESTPSQPPVTVMKETKEEPSDSEAKEEPK